MKIKHSILILLLLQSLETFGQVNTMVEEGMQWAVMVSSTGLEPTYLPKVETITSFLKGDSIVNNKTYKKVYSSLNRDLSDSGFSGCIRQDNKQVFYLPFNNTEEKLYFDFDLEAGDTFVLDDITRTVTSTSYCLINGIKHKTIFLESGKEQECWIEGIGSLTTGIFSDRFIVSGGKYLLLCCHRSDNLLYMNEEYNECYIQTHTDISKVNAKSEKPIVCYENRSIRIQGVREQLFKFELFDLSGERLFMSENIFSNEESVNIKCSKLMPGIYIYRLFNETCEYANKFQVKE